MSSTTNGCDAIDAVDLAASDQQELMAILDDFVERLQRGESVDVEDFIRAYPERADRLRGYCTMVFRRRPC